MFDSLESRKLALEIKFSDKVLQEVVLLESKTYYGEEATKRWQRFAPPFIVAMPPSLEALDDSVFRESYFRFRKHSKKSYLELKGEFE